MVLELYEMEDIQSAFKQWMSQSSTMPTPADILKLTIERSSSRKQQRQSGKNTPANRQGSSVVPWGFLSWEDMTPDLKRALKAHLKEMDDIQREDYQNYLTMFCKFPKRFQDYL